MPAAKQPGVDSFVEAVRKRLNVQRLARVAASAFCAASIVMLVVALAYVVRGYAVDWTWYLVVCGAAGAATIVAWSLSRRKTEYAARFADRFFGLKDALATYVNARRQGRIDGFYALQSEQTAAAVSALDAGKISWRPPPRPFWLGIGLVAVSLLLALKKPSDAVQQRLAREEATQQASVDSQMQLEQLVRDLEQGIDDPLERELLDPERLRRWVAELRATKDQKEALRQLARLEQRLQQARNKLRQRQDEQLLSRAAKELRKAEETESLGRTLQQQDYRQAREELQGLKPSTAQPLTAQQRDLARLKAAAQRMALASRDDYRGSPTATSRADQPSAPTQQQRAIPSENAAPAKLDSKSANNAPSEQSKPIYAADNDSGEESSFEQRELADTISRLESAVEDWNRALDQAVMEEKRAGQCDAETLRQCQAKASAASEQLNKLQDYLGRMAIKHQAAQKLGQLCLACSQCQNGLSQSPASSPNRGGKKAGWGSNTARREAQDELIDNGRTTPLTGVKGSGPSLSTIEAANEGSGATSRRDSQRARSYQRQLESFVSREDVPQDVKSGVSRYFQFIHQLDQTPPR